jgi:FkbM family methyltransferase
MKIIKHLDVKIPVYEDVFSPNLLKSFTDGKYEHQEARELGRIIQEGERILEIGAGVGFISTIVSRNPLTASVRCYEANPRLIPVIQEVHALNAVSNVEVRNGVLGHSGESATFYLRNDFWASSLSKGPFPYTGTVEVRCFDFNREIEEYRPTLIICDIEGGELELFESSVLSGVKKVYVEVHQRVLGRRGMLRLFQAMGLRGFHYDQHHSSGGVVLFSHIGRT